jgi:hypothetical protein
MPNPQPPLALQIHPQGYAKPLLKDGKEGSVTPKILRGFSLRDTDPISLAPASGENNITLRAVRIPSRRQWLSDRPPRLH